MRQNSELNNAVDTVVAAISQQLIVDTPGVDPNGEYYDYPDANNAWLANLEPYKNGTEYYWQQISDVTGYLKNKSFPTQNISVKPVGLSTTTYVNEYPVINVNSDGEFLNSDDSIAVYGVSADADGDGIADSKWIELADITTGRGEPVFAAIRVVDNGGMLNVNTAYKFDPCSAIQNEIDGSSQLQINLAELSQRGANGTLTAAADKLHSWRCNTSLLSYEPNVIWQYGNPAVGYTPFDISDELKLRNRYLLNFNEITTRIEELWENAYDGGPEVPLESSGTYQYSDSNSKKNDWLKCATFIEPNFYDYRHISTTYNMDRIINPFGERMVNINRPEDINNIHDAITRGLADAGVNDSALACQLTANLWDFVDTDSNVTVYSGWYGFERPCVYISELAYIPVKGPNDTYYNHYAIELYKPYFEDDDPIGWELVIDGNSIPIDWSTGSRRFYVRFFADMSDPCAADIADSINFTDVDEPNLYNPLYHRIVDSNDNSKFYSYHFVSGSSISLLRPVNGQYIVVDQYIIVVDPNWLVPGSISSIQRDISPHKCIRRLWSDAALPGHTLGMKNNYFDLDPSIIQAHPKNNRLTNIGEIGMVFQKSAYLVNKTDTQETVLVDLANPIYKYLFNYLTVLDPIDHNNPLAETRIKGRININTAPWYVLAQLPWVSSKVGYNDPTLAQNIAAYREVIGGYKSIGQLNNNIITGMQYYREGIDQKGFPDITPVKEFEPGDGAADDFEERDLIFARISDLVTVRSDVFTAYILVRLGQNGPQKRVMAILDRSDVRKNEGGNIVGSVKIRSLYPVPDPR
jgi:hypothetical protein